VVVGPCDQRNRNVQCSSRLRGLSAHAPFGPTNPLIICSGCFANSAHMSRCRCKFISNSRFLSSKYGVSSVIGDFVAKQDGSRTRVDRLASATRTNQVNVDRLSVTFPDDDNILRQGRTRDYPLESNERITIATTADSTRRPTCGTIETAS
jgi:hypothetical protein